MYEKRKLITHRIIWAFLLLAGIIIPIVALFYTASKEVNVVDDNGYINNYYESLNRTECEIEVVFNTNVNSGYITVAFYDSNGELLSTKENYFYGNRNTLSSTFFIDGKVDSYEILGYDISASSGLLLIIITFFIFADIFIFAFFIASLFLSYKIYDYNGAEIIVYAGWYHHYIKVSQVMLDEHNTIISFSPIILSTTLGNGTKIQATISLTNRISLKINDQLYPNRK